MASTASPTITARRSEKYGTKRIYIAYDRDDAGERAAEELAEELLAMGIECFRVQFPKGMDANDYALKVTPAAKSLGVLLEQRGLAWQRPAAHSGSDRAANQSKKNQRQQLKKKSPRPWRPAAKEKITDRHEAKTNEKSELPLAAECSEPIEHAPVPPSPALEVPMEINGDEIKITQGDRRYRVLGLEKNTTVGILRVNLLVTRGERLHVDTFDLYPARHRAIYSKQASEELRVKEEVVSRDLGKVLWKLEELQRQLIQKTLEPKEEEIH